MVDPLWLQNSSVEELQVYHDFVRDISSTERFVIANRDLMGKGDYEIGEMIGKEEILYCSRKGSKTIQVVGSNYVDGIMQKTRADLIMRLQEKFPNVGEGNGCGRILITDEMESKERDLYKVWYANAVGNGFKRMMFEQLFPNAPRFYPGTSEDFRRRMVRGQQFEMAALYLDVPRLSEAFENWKAKSKTAGRALRMA